MKHDMNTDTGRPRDVFAEVAEIAVDAAFADTAARRLAAGDIAHALGAAYPELAAAALRRKPAPRLRWTWAASASGIRYMTATDADGMIVFAASGTIKKGSSGTVKVVKGAVTTVIAPAKYTVTKSGDTVSIALAADAASGNVVFVDGQGAKHEYEVTASAS